MKTRKIKKTKKGGVLGLRYLKTKSDNKKNCYSLAKNYKKKRDLLYKAYGCDTRKNPECKNIVDDYPELNKYCENNKYIDNYDFSRDGLHVKDRTEPFLDLRTVPQNVDGEPWYNMNLFKDINNSYELKNDDDNGKDFRDFYNSNERSESF
jgi:hypothetical protein